MLIRSASEIGKSKSVEVHLLLANAEIKNFFCLWLFRTCLCGMVFWGKVSRWPAVKELDLGFCGTSYTSQS